MARQKAGAKRRAVRLPREVIREFSDRGFQWLLEDPMNARELLSLADPELADRLDFSEAVFLPRSYIPPNLRKHERDVLMQAPLIDPATGERTRLIVCFLLEHQSAVDRWMGLRLLIYMALIWQKQFRQWEAEGTPEEERHLMPIIPMVFYTGRSAWSCSLDLQGLFPAIPGLERFQPHWESLLLELRSLRPEDLREGASALSQALLVWQAEGEPVEELERRLREALAGLESLDESRHSDWERALLFISLLLLHRRSPEDHSRLIPLVEQGAVDSKFRLREVETMVKTMAQDLEERGEERGEKREARRIILRQGARRFGAPDAATTAAIEAIDDQALLEQLSLRLLEVESWAELLANA